eukprot:symbB.v1.2.022818.t1/scaffold2042.1/size196763/1
MRDEAPLTGAAAKFGDFRELVNKTCPGKVTGLVDFGAWVEVTSEKGTTRGALLPASEIEDCYVEDPAEFLEEGQCFHNGLIGPVASPWFTVALLVLAKALDVGFGAALQIPTT